MCLSSLPGLDGQVVRFRLAVGGLEPCVASNLGASCCLTLAQCALDKLPLVGTAFLS